MAELGYGFAYRVLDAQYVRVDGFGRAVLSDEGVCSLSDTLEAGDVPQKYYLERQSLRWDTALRCQAGKDLPPMLHRALSAVTEALNAPEILAAKIQ